MPTKTSVPRVFEQIGNESSVSLKELFETKVKEEKTIIDGINANFNQKREDVIKTHDIKEASAYLEKERGSFKSFFGQFGEKTARLETTKTALRKQINKNALKKFASLRELATINSQNISHVQNAFHANHLVGDQVRGPLSDLEILLPEDNPFIGFDPPYELWEADNIGESFDEDNSFPWADWGTLAHNVRFADSNSFFESGSSYKYAWNSVAVGINFRMLKHGTLDVVVVITNQENRIDYSASDNFGPSDASFDIENMIFIPVSTGGVRKHLHAATLVDAVGRSDGDDISGTISPIASNQRFIFSFRVGHVHEGENVQIMVASWFRVYSTLYNMNLDINSSLLWRVENIYIRVQ